MFENMDSWFWILHFFSLNIFHTFYIPFPSENLGEKSFTFFTHFTVIFQVKIRVINFLDFSPTFSAENVYELLVVHLLEKS